MSLTYINNFILIRKLVYYYKHLTYSKWAPLVQNMKKQVVSRLMVKSLK